MIIIEDSSSFRKSGFNVVTIGTFDGVHFGHRKILKKIVNQAKEQNGLSVVVTLWPHPRFVLEGESSTLKLLTTFEEKAQIMKELGIDVIVKIPFTREFSQTSSEDFIQNILIRDLGTNRLVIGYDHHFGKNREGSFEYLQENADRYGFEIEEIPRQDIDDVGVSSTKIRDALLVGHIEEANHYLGRQYSFSGKVVHGEKIGRDIGYPTANIEPGAHFKLIPCDGVYAVSVGLGDEELHGMMYIGNKPTLKGTRRFIEVNIFEFDRDIYDRELTINFIDKVRGDMTFSSLEALSGQLSKDKIDVLNIIKQQPKND